MIDYSYTVGELRSAEPDIIELGKTLGWIPSAHPANVVRHALQELQRLKALGVVELSISVTPPHDEQVDKVVEALVHALREERKKSLELSERLNLVKRAALRLGEIALRPAKELQDGSEHASTMG